MFFADGAIDLEVATHGVLIENHFYLLIDLGGALQPCFCASQPLATCLSCSVAEAMFLRRRAS